MICKTQKVPKVPTHASTAMTVLKTNIKNFETKAIVSIA
jgi:hypothetical protein